MSNTITLTLPLNYLSIALARVAKTPDSPQRVDVLNALADCIDLDLMWDAANILKGENTPTNAPASQAPVTETEEETLTEDTSPFMSYQDFKAAMKQAKELYSEEFCMDVLKAHDCKLNSSLGRSLAGIPESMYTSILQTIEKGPEDALSDTVEDPLEGEVIESEPAQEQSREVTEVQGSLFENLDDDALEGEDIDIESVADALKAYAKECGKDKARAIMKANGANSLSDLSICSLEQLSRMMNACNDL